VAELRGKTEDTFSLAIVAELDGPLRQFGKRAWELVASAVPNLRKKIADKSPLTAMHYCDRYLRSPLSFLLLNEVLVAGLALVDSANTADVTVETSTLAGNDIQEPKFLHHNWRDSEDRRYVFNSVFKATGSASLVEKFNGELPHARALHLAWKDGTNTTIRLDQGIGYWRSAKGPKAFPFDQSPERQSKFLEELDLSIEASSQSHSTFWYLA